MSGIEKAISSFRGDFNCSQSILSSYATKYGLDRETALRIATGFGGGMGRMQNTCGAVSGAFMVIGLRYGMGINGDIEARDKTYQVIREFSNRFQERHGSIICRELLGCDINTPEGKNYYDQNDLFEKKCFQYVKDSAMILEDLL
ncbi:MAG: C_GCAxxG_C_C family protein [Promethearchaeota archaeon]|nr:MAG: C_GCAxxG_C_C family protein [Candidatus Lokiarchaeota archaeon]